MDTSIKQTRTLKYIVFSLFLLLKTSIKRTLDWIDNSSIGLLPWNTYCNPSIKINQYI